MESRRTRYYVLYSNSGRGSFRHFAPIYRSRYSLPARRSLVSIFRFILSMLLYFIDVFLDILSFSLSASEHVVSLRTYLTDFVLDKYLIIVKRQYFRLLLLMLKCNLVNIPMYLSKVMITCVLY